jgi:hypothetical protein
LESVILDGDRDLEALAERLADFEAKERTVLRLELAGRLDLRAAARLESLLERTRDLFAGLDVRDADLRVAAEEEDLADLELSGFAARAAATLRDASQGGDSVSRDALALLVRLASESGEAA